jgi:uncharacterized protein YkwD
MMTRKLLAILVFFSLMIALSIPASIVRADSEVTPQDLINLMNGLRTANGYTALVVDPVLMQTAQATADYMAANNMYAHIGNVRGRVADAGYGSGQVIFATENWAAGSSTLTISQIQSYWADPDHMLMATVSYYKNIGAGIATSQYGTWYVVQAAYIAGGYANPTQDPNTTLAPTTSEYMQPLVTSTPLPDGTIYHIVQYGQTLWQIALAYNTHIETLQELNNLSGTNIMPDEKLLIQPSLTPTTAPTITSTPTLPTRTPTSSVNPRTPSFTFTPTATLTPTPVIAALPKLDRRAIGLIIIGVCALGLGGVLAFSFIRKKPK